MVKILLISIIISFTFGHHSFAFEVNQLIRDIKYSIQVHKMLLRDMRNSKKTCNQNIVKDVTITDSEVERYDYFVRKLEIDRYIEEAARMYELPTSLLKALIKVESNFNIRAVSSKGCIGLTQLSPQTAKELGIDPWNPRQNILGGAVYFRRMYDRYGSVEEALWAYNAGPERVEQNILPEESRKFVNKVKRYWRFYQVYENKMAARK